MNVEIIILRATLQSLADAAARLSVRVPYSVGDQCGIHTAINRAYAILSYPAADAPADETCPGQSEGVSAGRAGAGRSS